MGSLNVDGYSTQQGRGGLIEVECRTLDSVVQGLDIEPDFMKIDVEGFRDAVLRGATWVLETLHPRLVL